MTKRSAPALNIPAPTRPLAFDVGTKAYDSWDRAVTAAQTPENTITILDVIGEDFFGEGVTSRRVSGALRRIGSQDVFVDINSPGGDFFEGVAIYNLLREHPGRVTVRVLGLAASAASIIAEAGDEVLIGKAGFMMIHNTQIVALGDRHDMREVADVLEVFDAGMAGLYAERMGLDAPAVAEMLDAETWFDGAAAVAQGLATDFLPADAVAMGEEPAPRNALRETDRVLARAGLTRNKRRELLNEIKGMHDAAPHATRDAGETEAVAMARRLIATMKKA